MRIFETWTATGRDHFACQDRIASQIFILLVSNGENIHVLSNVNVVVWGQVKSENSSLPVVVHASKTHVLKLSNIKNLFFFCQVQWWKQFLYYPVNLSCFQPQWTSPMYRKKIISWIWMQGIHNNMLKFNNLLCKLHVSTTEFPDPFLQQPLQYKNHFHREALHLYQASSFLILHRPVLFQILFGRPRNEKKQMNITSKTTVNIT